MQENLQIFRDDHCGLRLDGRGDDMDSLGSGRPAAAEMMSLKSVTMASSKAACMLARARFTRSAASVRPFLRRISSMAASVSSRMRPDQRTRKNPGSAQGQQQIAFEVAGKGARIDKRSKSIGEQVLHVLCVQLGEIQ
ncbi:hypothetical protein ACNJYA_11085 [Bradyrhizobium sp. DASA03068]|uniref:hypothetical protein n=1 Tax=Bradyrhizobium sp. BLXBL-01 TaxID=3395915 RepID=UPI003F72DE40